MLLLTTEYPDLDTPDTPLAIADEIRLFYQGTYHIELLHGEMGFETHPGQGNVVTARTEEKIYLLSAREPHPHGATASANTS